MKNNSTVTDSKIRQHVLATDSAHLSVTIKRNGEIHVRTNRERGDGGSTPWTMFAGFRSDIAAEIERHG